MERKNYSTTWLITVVLYGTWYNLLQSEGKIKNCRTQEMTVRVNPSFFHIIKTSIYTLVYVRYVMVTWNSSAHAWHAHSAHASHATTIAIVVIPGIPKKEKQKLKNCQYSLN